ncbi:MAG: alpha/beta hydrolase [Opitutus sp.]|nr:alpha/beta hydrolase [Opitutus sp.]
MLKKINSSVRGVLVFKIKVPGPAPQRGLPRARAVRAHSTACLFGWAAFACALFSVEATLAGASATDDARLKQALQRYPEADTDKDGVLTEAEARAHLKKLRSSKAGKSKSADAKAATSLAGPKPTLAEVPYGPHERNVLDFWKAKSDQPTPVVIFIHGGGFEFMDKSKAREGRMLRECLDAGVSYAAINYRYRTSAPIQEVLRDCARAIQFIRRQAGEWNVDKTRLAAHGPSAGAGASLWLAFHDDLADPQSSDPVQRESSRLAAAGAVACQFSHDLLAWDKLFANSNNRFKEIDDRPGYYGLKTDEELRGPVGRKIRADCDMHGLISRDDPPVFLDTGFPGGDITSRGHLLHHPLHAKAIYDRCRELGVGVVAQIPALKIMPGKDDPHNLQEFLFQHLKVASATATTKPVKAPTAK